MVPFWYACDLSWCAFHWDSMFVYLKDSLKINGEICIKILTAEWHAPLEVINFWCCLRCGSVIFFLLFYPVRGFDCWVASVHTLCFCSLVQNFRTHRMNGKVMKFECFCNSLMWLCQFVFSVAGLFSKLRILPRLEKYMIYNESYF